MTSSVITTLFLDATIKIKIPQNMALIIKQNINSNTHHKPNEKNAMLIKPSTTNIPQP